MKGIVRPQKVVCECGAVMFAQQVGKDGDKETITCLRQACAGFGRVWELPGQEVELVEVPAAEVEPGEPSVQPVRYAPGGARPLEQPAEVELEVAETDSAAKVSEGG